jgi:hypothetical protein
VNRKLETIGACFCLIAGLTLGAGIANGDGQSKLAVAASTGASAPVVKATRPRTSPMTPVEVGMHLQQLERVKRRFELSAGGNRASHSALAARHIQMAINEMKLEIQEQAHGKNLTQPGQPRLTGSSGRPAVAPLKVTSKK